MAKLLSTKTPLKRRVHSLWMQCCQCLKRMLEHGNSLLMSLSCRTCGRTSAWSLTLSFRELAQCYVRVSVTRTWIRLNLLLVSSNSSQLSIWSGGYSAFTGVTLLFWDLQVITNSWRHSLEEASKRVNRSNKPTRSLQCETHMKTLPNPYNDESTSNNWHEDSSGVNEEVAYFLVPAT